MVSHGHITVNGQKVTIPSYKVSLGDKITIRESSAKKGIFANLDEKLKDHSCPSWLVFDVIKKEGKVQGAPKLSTSETIFDPTAILNFYSR
jgi:small subunit ribosomal protein S4